MSNDMVVQQQGQQLPDSSDNVTLGDYTEVETKVASNVSTMKCAYGNTLLHEAALHLPPGAIDTLISHSLHHLQVDDATPADETALILAYEEMVGVVERLLANGASATTYRSRRKGATLLHIAALNSRVGTVRALVRFGHIPVDVVDDKNNTPLMYACRSGDSDRSQACIRELIDLGANINYQGKHGNTVLHHTAQNEHSSEVLKLLLSYPQTKVDVNNAEKQTALKVARDQNNLTAIKLLLEHGALLSEQEKSAISDECLSVFTEYDDKCKRLINAVICNDKILIQNYLLEQGNVNIRIRGCSLLHVAAARAGKDMMKLLIEAGIPIDVRNAAKETPLIVACRGNKVDNVRALLKEWKADINARTGYGSSVLHVAAEHSCMDVLDYLLKYCSIDVNCRDNCDRTPLTVACLAGNDAAAKRIMTMDDCDINAIDYYSSPLHGAVHCNHQDLVAYLLGQGTIRANAATIADQQTPLHVVQCNSEPNIAKMLIKSQPTKDNSNLEDIYGRLPKNFGACCMCQNATLTVQGNATASAGSNASSEETAPPLQTASSSGGEVTNVSQPMTETSIMARNIINPSGHLADGGAMAAAVTMRGDDTADGHTLVIPIEDYFNHDPLHWRRILEKHITKDLAELVKYTKMKMPFVDSMRSAGFLASNEYNDLEANKNEEDRSRMFFNHILPQKGYAAFEFAIQALNDTGSDVIASKCRHILDNIKADIEQKS